MQQYDIIIIGTGAGGGTLLHKLAPSGKKILVLERGNYLPQEKQNWDDVEVFQKERYHTKDIWLTEDGQELHPGTGYWVGGNTKVYGAALFRLRERDFDEVRHAGGISAAWPLKYKDYESYYTEAEQLYEVRGKMGLDPTEPYRSKEYPYPNVVHEQRIQELHNDLIMLGNKPFFIPLAIKRNETDTLHSKCIKCDTCDGFPCLLHAKSDADINCVRPSLVYDNVTLLTDALVTKLVTTADGKTISHVDVTYMGEELQFSGNIVVVACGAINSAVLLLQSANDKHSNGLANSSDQVGRNFMKHQNAAVLSISTKPNPTIFQKTLAINDYYWGDEDYPYPMGGIQLLGKSSKGQLAPDAPFFTPGVVLDGMAKHSVDWWLMGEDLAIPRNRVQVVNGCTVLNYTANNEAGFERLAQKWKHVLSKIDSGRSFLPHDIYIKKNIPLSGIAHQAGTLRFGTDAAWSVLDVNCKAHDLDNLYVVDGSFFPSIGAVNPSLTIMANALRVGDHLIERMK